MKRYTSRTFSPEEAQEIDFALALMSLDLAKGTMDPMGFVITDEVAFRTVIREEFGRQPLGVAAGEAGVARVLRFLRRLEMVFGAPLVDRLVVWIHDFFLGPSDPQVFFWHRMIANVDLDCAEGGRPLPILVKLVRKELSELLRDASSYVPSSQWDKDLLTAYGFPTLSRREGMSTSPVNIIENHLDDIAFVAAWHRALALSTSPEEDIDALWSWGKTEGAAMGLRKLARPGSFAVEHRY